jgi:hypothetical protein
MQSTAMPYDGHKPSLRDRCLRQGSAAVACFARDGSYVARVPVHRPHHLCETRNIEHYIACSDLMRPFRA